MAQHVKQLAKIAAIAVMATMGLAGEASANNPQDTKARLLADIAFEYAELGNSERLDEVLDQALRSTRAMEFQCFQGNPLARIAGSYLLIGQDEQGKPLLTEAIETAQRQEATGCSGSGTSPTESLGNRAKEYAEDGHLDLAIELGRGLGDPLTLAEVAGHLAEAGQSERATELLNQAITLAQGIDDQYYRTQTLSYMAYQLRTEGHTELVPPVLEQALESNSAFDLAQSREAASLQVSSLLWIARELAANGAESQAIAVLDQAMAKIQVLSNQPYPLDRIQYQVDVAVQYGELAQEAKAKAILADALAEAKSLPVDDTNRYLENAVTRVAEAHAQMGDFERALQIAETIKAVAERGSVFQQIALAQARAGNVEAAVELAQMGGSRGNATLVEITRHYLTEKQPDQAWNFVQTYEVEGILAEVALGYVEAGQPEQALQLVQSDSLVSSMPAAGQTDQALQIAETQPAETQQLDWLLPAIARGFAEQGQLETALQVAESINDKIYKAQAFIAVAQGYTTKDSAEQGRLRSIFANLIDFTTGLFGDSKREKVAAVLEQAIEVTESL
ncbi:hypothetical protein IQ265_19610 [Nodosilinea sp. LEGE 06152]|uniref:tetratricopeptide repeat protein n=1 Tax=Nodosilinea sp. LEGE 06152 TaxID=2777966 RepID=UPI00187E529E|nr:hypothetical protein [Nodosilinea sp. LEGE 06152]MBE9159025.1 hypothetical protein [Nodosilinea sp. LEGE 06152]